MNSPTPASRRGHGSWTAFIAWAGVGAGAGLGVLSILTIGAILIAAAVTAGVLVAFWRRSAHELFGAISGLALPLFYVAYLNRSGPGDVCTSSTTGSSCTQQWSPWPWLLTGLLLAASGVIAFLAYRRHMQNRIGVQTPQG